MDINFNLIFNYLKSESIVYDKEEFLFQIQSHPDYPSLLAVSDTLHFFKINHIVAKVGIDKINLLPSCFVALLKEKNLEDEHLYFIQRKKDGYLINKEKAFSKIDEKKLESRWSDLVLLLEKTANTDFKIKKDKKLFYAKIG